MANREINGQLMDTKLKDNYLIMNNSELKNDVFIFAVSSICHEMMHVFD